jgi:hypothetical protein
MPVLDRTVPYNLDYQIPHRRLTEFGQRGVRSRPRFGARRAALTAGAAGQHGLTRAIRLLRKSAHLLDGDGQSPIVHLWVSVGFLSQLRFKLPINPAGSTGRCNTGLQFTRGGFKAQGLSRALIEAQSYLVEIGLRVDGQVGLLGEVLS